MASSQPQGDSMDRTVVIARPTEDNRGRVRKAIDTLSARFTQNVETDHKQPGFRISHGGMDRIKPPSDLSDHREMAMDVPIVRKSITDFASDVVEPGYRIETDDETVREYLEDVWCPQAAIIGGEKHNDLLPFLRSWIFELWRGGEILAEHVRSDPNSPDSHITGLQMISPEHVEHLTYHEKSILVDPDPVDQVQRDDVAIDPIETARGEAAAYIIYGSGALISTRRSEVPLSQNDVTRSVLDPGAGEVRGTPITQTIGDDVAGFQNILRDGEAAIQAKAWGIWEVSFGRETIEYTELDPETGQPTEITEIIQWSDDDQDEFVEENLNTIEPGAILTHDGVIGLNRIEGEIPDIIPILTFYVSNIVSALPTPLYIVGFETNINQFVTQSQDSRYQKLINENRKELERKFTDTVRRVVEQNLVENTHRLEDGRTFSVSEVPEDLQFKVEPAEEESPVLSLSDEEIERMEKWASAFADVRGDLPVEFFADPAVLSTLILQMPDDAAPDDIVDRIQAEIDEAQADIDADQDEIDEQEAEQFAALRRTGD